MQSKPHGKKLNYFASVTYSALKYALKYALTHVKITIARTYGGSGEKPERF